MKISVIMLTYNHGKYIEKAVQSVCAQQGDFQLEIIIGDDCSTDNTASSPVSRTLLLQALRTRAAPACAYGADCTARSGKKVHRSAQLSDTRLPWGNTLTANFCTA